MNKKVTREEMNKLFPGATILTEGGNFALPICREGPSLKVIVPGELPLGVNFQLMIPGEFYAVGNVPMLSQALSTTFAVQIAAGRLEEDDGPRFYLEDPLGARQLLVVSRWQLVPPMVVAAGLDSPFAKDYQVALLERLTPPERTLKLNPVLRQVPPSLEEPYDDETGLDFWVIERTDFYCPISEMLSQNLRQMIALGDRENYNQATHNVCRKLIEEQAIELEKDPKLPGWKLVCKDANAQLTLIDSHGTERTLDLFYTPAYMSGLMKYIDEGRRGILILQ